MNNGIPFQIRNFVTEWHFLSGKSLAVIDEARFNSLKVQQDLSFRVYLNLLSIAKIYMQSSALDNVVRTESFRCLIETGLSLFPRIKIDLQDFLSTGCRWVQDHPQYTKTSTYFHSLETQDRLRTIPTWQMKLQPLTPTENYRSWQTRAQARSHFFFTQ